MNNKLCFRNKIFTKKILLILLLFFSIVLFLISIPSYQWIALENAYHRPYEKYVFDCDDFSKLLVTKLNDAGYIADWVVSKDAMLGMCNTNSIEIYEAILDRNLFCHAWVVIKYEDFIIPIESTTGEVMPIELHNEYLYGTKDGNNEWLYLK
jgi:hypothetical protein